MPLDFYHSIFLQLSKWLNAPTWAPSFLSLCFPGLILSLGPPMRTEVLWTLPLQDHPSTAAENRISKWNQKPWRKVSSVKKPNMTPSKDVYTNVAATCGPLQVAMSSVVDLFVYLPADIPKYLLILYIHATENISFSFYFVISFSCLILIHIIVSWLIFYDVDSCDEDQERWQGSRGCNCWLIDLEIEYMIFFWAFSVDSHSLDVVILC